MKKITRQKDYMRLAAATAVTLLLGGEAAALTCTAAPDCADLGYT